MVTPMSQIEEARLIAASRFEEQGWRERAADVLAGASDEQACVQMELARLVPDGKDPALVPEAELIVPLPSPQIMGIVENIAGTAGDHFDWPAA